MPGARASVLVVDDEPDMVESCAFFLDRAGYEVQTALSGEEALRKLDRIGFSVVITDVKMPRMSGLALLEAIKARDPDVEVLLITSYPEVETAVAAMRQGALDYIQKPFDETSFMARVEKALAHRQVRDRNAGLKERLRQGVSGRRLVHRSQAMADVLATLERAARTDASILILGESGTGKELLAHHLHDASPRAERPFVPVDCATIPENLVESELFGHVRGAFSGADANKLGLFQVADGGTLFLDEVGELPLAFQPKLLRAIQERHVRRVGAGEYTDVDVRIVCATNRNLAQMVEDGAFRQDLFYRLDVVRIEVPPLREHAEDVEPLAQHFLALARKANPAILRFAPEALAELRAYPWPGNVRQLRNAIERAVALGSGPEIQHADLPPEVRGEPAGTVALTPADCETFMEMKARKVAAMEQTYVETLLRRHGGNVTRSAEAAGMARSAFQKLMQRYGIRSSEFRE